MMTPDMPWVTARDGAQIVALQHACGVDGAPVNCVIDENQNWFCPSCSEIYGAAFPLAAWALRVSNATNGTRSGASNEPV